MLVSAGVTPVVFGVALFFGGLAQLLAGLIQMRTGKTFNGVLFTGFGTFWMSLFAYVQWFAKAVPAAQAGHAMGLFLYAFAIFAAIMFLTSLRSIVVVVAALAALTAALALLGAGNYGASTSLIHLGGWTGVIVAAMAFYLSASELCEATLWPGSAPRVAAQRLTITASASPRAGQPCRRVAPLQGLGAAQLAAAGRSES